MKYSLLLLTIAALPPACAPSTVNEPVQQFRIEATGTVACLVTVTRLLMAQDIGGYDAPQWQTNGTGTASFEPVPAPRLERAKASIRSAKCVTQLRVTKVPEPL